MLQPYKVIIWLIALVALSLARPYDPEDKEIEKVIPPAGMFEAFYQRSKETEAVRPAHSHGSFYQYRNPALVEVKNAAAYGFRFDGKRRFNYD